MYTNLTGETSVHLSNFPEVTESVINEALEKQMWQVRQIAEVGHAKRKELKIKVKQPLQELRITNYELRMDEGLLGLLKDELNIKGVSSSDGEGVLTVDFDTELTPELQAEGEAREIIRKIQEERKKLGTALDEKVTVTIESYPESFVAYIKKKAMVAEMTKGESFSVTKM
jgi:isoleucyl-tRNA synthetase